MGRDNRIDSGSIKPQQADDLTLSEVRDDPDSIEIETISPRDHAHFVKLLEETALAEEIVEVVVAKDKDKHALAVVTPNVNGTNQPIVRGVPTRVKLKYVLALAYSKQTTYDQEQMDMHDMSSLTNVPVTTQSYPFEVRRCTANARALLEHVLAQPL